MPICSKNHVDLRPAHRPHFFSYSSKGRDIQRPYDRYVPRVRELASHLSSLVDDLLPANVHGWRRHHSVTTAVEDIRSRTGSLLSFDIYDFFGSVDQERLARKLNRLDAELWPELLPFLPNKGLPTGFAFSPHLGNLYLVDVDRRFPLVRYADNIMIIEEDPHRVFLKMRRHLADIGLTCHEVDFAPTTFCKQSLIQEDSKEVIPANH